MNDLELLAPAGNYESLRAAIVNGANAVYLGLDKYSARAKAFNFGENEFRNAVEFAHLYGVRVYVALNTLIKNSEFSDVLKSAEFAYDTGADAFIVQDLGLLSELKKVLPRAEIHASTQMGIHNKEGAKILEGLGVKRVILSRETTLDDIYAIRNATDLEIEFFVHGALCVSFSGNCYFSGLVSGNSGNRGQCLQFCRKRYTFNCGEVHKNGYMLSAKDLMLLDDLSNLANAGVTSFKIEGRMRRPAYVGEAVRAYSNAIDCLNENRVNESFEHDLQALKSMFNRGDYCKAHLYEPTADVVYPHINGHTGLKIGKVEQIFNGKATIRSDKNLISGDGVKFVRNRTEVGSASVTSDNNVTGFSGNVRRGDEVFLTTDSTLVNEIEKRNRYIDVKATARFKIGEKATLELFCNSAEISEESDIVVEQAANAPIDKERLSEIIAAQSDEFFKIILENADVDDNIFIPVAAVKKLKRSALSKLRENILNKYSVNAELSRTVTDIVYSFPTFVYNAKSVKQTFVQIENVKAAELLGEYDGFIDYYVFNPRRYDLSEVQSFAEKYGRRAVLNLPNAARGEDISVLRRIVTDSGINNFVANNLYALELCKDKNILCGFMLNMINGKIKTEKLISPECGMFDRDSVNYVFGKLPLMTFCHCEKKNITARDCKNCGGYSVTLKDERDNEFPIRRYKIKYCYSSLMNNLPIFLADKAREIGVEKTFVDFTDFSEKEIVHCAKSIFGNVAPDFPYTRGYYNKTLR